MSPVGIDEVRRFTIASGEPRHRAFPGAVRLSSGEILVFYREGSDHWRTVDGVVKMVRSQDEGKSWTAPEIVFAEPGWGCGAHHGPTQLSDGRVVVPLTMVGSYDDLPSGVDMRGKVYLINSEDGSNSWSEPLLLGRWKAGPGRTSTAAFRSCRTAASLSPVEARKLERGRAIRAISCPMTGAVALRTASM